jgi:hypothetical protein
MTESAYSAVNKHGSEKIVAVLNNFIRPLYLINQDIIANKPKYITKLPLVEAIEVVEKCKDLNLLAKIISVNDKRLKLGKAINKHKRVHQARRLVLLNNHPWLGKSIKEVEEIILEPGNLPEQRYMNLSKITFGNHYYELLITYLRSLPEKEKAHAYERAFIKFKDIFFTGEIEIDIKASLVNGISLNDLNNDILNEGDKPSISELSASELTRILSFYRDITKPIAQIETDSNIKLDLDNIDSIDEESVEHLLSTQSSVQLFEKGYVKDYKLLLPVIADLNVATRIRLARVVIDSTITSHLIKDLYYRSRLGASDINELLDIVPDLDIETKIICLSHCSPYEFSDFLRGKYLNSLNPGELPIIIDSYYKGLADTKYGFYINKEEDFIKAIGQSQPSENVIEGIEHLFLNKDNLVQILLNDLGLVGKRAVEKITETLGEDTTLWDNLLRLSGQWSGNLYSLINAAQRL